MAMHPRRRAAAALLLAGLTAPLAAQQPAPATRPSLDALVVAERADSNDPPAHYALAMGYWDAKRWDEAEAALHAAADLAPEYADAWLALAALPRARGEKYWRERLKRDGQAAVDSVMQRSAQDYRHAFLINPLVDLRVLGKFEDATHYVRFGRYVVMVSFWWDADYLKSLNDFRDGRYDRAFDRLDKLVRDRRSGNEGADAPADVLWYHGLAAAHLQRFDVGVHDFAVLTGRAVADQAAEKRVTSLPLAANDYRYVLATMLYLGGRFDEAAPVYRRALEFDLGLYPAHVQLARIAEAAKDWDTAVRERRAAVDANGGDPSLLVDLGATLWQAGRIEEAATTLQGAAAAAPRDARASYLAGVALLQAGRNDAAKAAFTHFLAIAPRRFAPQVDEVTQQLAALP
jgi:tetratricopeptide (TPR) repeat protein